MTDEEDEKRFAQLYEEYGRALDEKTLELEELFSEFASLRGELELAKVEATKRQEEAKKARAAKRRAVENRNHFRDRVAELELEKAELEQKLEKSETRRARMKTQIEKLKERVG